MQLFDKHVVKQRERERERERDLFNSHYLSLFDSAE